MIGCAGQLTTEAAELDAGAGNPCGAPTFAAGDCTDEILNDGTGPDDHRRVCVVGADKWILYPSGEQWHFRAKDSGDPTLCHGAADGAVLWSVDGG